MGCNTLDCGFIGIRGLGELRDLEGLHCVLQNHGPLLLGTLSIRKALMGTSKGLLGHPPLTPQISKPHTDPQL